MIQHTGKNPRSCFEQIGAGKPTAKRTGLAAKSSEEHQKEIDALEELCDKMGEDENNKKRDERNKIYGYKRIQKTAI